MKHSPKEVVTLNSLPGTLPSLTGTVIDSLGEDWQRHACAQLLEDVRASTHLGEHIKWGHPHFDYAGAAVVPINTRYTGTEAMDIVERVHTLMDRARRHAVQSSTGIHRPGQASWVHGRSGRPCRRCGDTVRVALVGEPPRARTVFSCPTCQGGFAPSDDRRPQRPLGSVR